MSGPSKTYFVISWKRYLSQKYSISDQQGAYVNIIYYYTMSEPEREGGWWPQEQLEQFSKTGIWEVQSQNVLSQFSCVSNLPPPLTTRANLTQQPVTQGLVCLLARGDSLLCWRSLKSTYHTQIHSLKPCSFFKRKENLHLQFRKVHLAC